MGPPAPLVSLVRRTLRTRDLVHRGDHVLVACSGGVDSVVLLHALHALAPEFGLTLAVATVEHGLRDGIEGEVALVERHADALGLPFHLVRLGLERGRPGVQARAREARYAALLGLRGEVGAVSVAVGHTRDDQAETVLERICRGAGLAGLSGIDPARADGVLRPLIDVTRAEVQAFAEARELGFVEDPSNADRGYLRVRLRHEVLPALRAEDPQVATHLADLADEAREAISYLDRRAERWLERHGNREGTLPVGRALRLAAPVRDRVLLHWVVKNTGIRPSRAQRAALGHLLSTEEGHVLLDGGTRLSVDAGRLIVERALRWSSRSHGAEPCGQSRAAPQD